MVSLGYMANHESIVSLGAMVTLGTMVWHGAMARLGAMAGFGAMAGLLLRSALDLWLGLYWSAMKVTN